MAVSHPPQAPVACPQQLTGARRDAWVGLLRVHAAVTRALDADLLVHCRLSLSAFEVLARVACAPEGHLRISDLAHAALLSQSRVSRLVDALEAEGYLERRSCPRDSRVVHATITERGRRLADEAAAVHAAAVDTRFLAHLSEEQVAELCVAWEQVLGSQG
jgi:DNA-binding MarR family transcriptional regulator